MPLYQSWSKNGSLQNLTDTEVQVDIEGKESISLSIRIGIDFVIKILLYLMISTGKLLEWPWRASNYI